MSPPDGVTGDTRYFKTDEIENKIVSFLDNTQTIWLSPVRNKENEFHRQDPITRKSHAYSIILCATASFKNN